MRAQRENVIRYEYLDGVQIGCTTLVNRAVYKLKDGTEQINWCRGKRTITRNEVGTAVWHHHCKTVQPIILSEWAAKWA